MRISRLGLRDFEIWEIDDLLFKNANFEISTCPQGEEVDPNRRLRNSLIYHILKRVPKYSSAYRNNSEYSRMKNPMCLEEARIKCDLAGCPHGKCEKYLLFIMSNNRIDDFVNNELSY